MEPEQSTPTELELPEQPKLSRVQRWKLRRALKKTRKEIAATENLAREELEENKPKLQKILLEFNKYLVFEDDTGKEIREEHIATLSYKELRKYAIEGCKVLERYQ